MKRQPSNLQLVPIVAAGLALLVTSASTRAQSTIRYERPYETRSTYCQSRNTVVTVTSDAPSVYRRVYVEPDYRDTRISVVRSRPAYVEPRYVEPVYVQPRYVEPVYNDPGDYYSRDPYSYSLRFASGYGSYGLSRYYAGPGYYSGHRHHHRARHLYRIGRRLHHLGHVFRRGHHRRFGGHHLFGFRRGHHGRRFHGLFSRRFHR